MPLANFRALGSTVSALDPDTPISAVFGADNVATYGPFLPFVDFAAADYYPVRTTPGWDTPAKMRQTVGRAQDLVNSLGPSGAGPVWVAQAFDTPTPGYALPTASQQRYLTWAPVTVGVKGAMYFAFQHMSQAERESLVYSVTDELVPLIPAIVSDLPAPAVTSDRDNSTPGDGINDVTYITRVYDDSLYIVASGNQLLGQGVQFTIHDTFTVGTTVEVVGESRTITPAVINPGSLVFSDLFNALSVHLYRLPLPLPPYDAWADAFGLTGTNAAFGADRDGERALNGYEWATGTIPTNALSFTPLSITRTGQTAWVGFTRNTNATDVTVRLQRTDDPADTNTWSTFLTHASGGWTPHTIVTESGAGNPVDVQVSDIATGATMRAYRLQVSRP